VAEVLLLNDQLRRVTQRYEIPKRRHLRQVVLEEFLMELSNQRDKLLADMLNGASVEQDKVKCFGALRDVFLPLRQTTSAALRLRLEVLEEAEEALVFNVRRLDFEQTFDLFQIVEHFLWLLQVVLVAGFEHALFVLLIVEKPQFDLDVHRVFKLFDSLLHRAKVGCEVVFGLLLNKWKHDCELVEKVVDSVENRVQRKVCIR